MEEVKESQRDSDADLGYIIMYARSIHAFLADGGELSDRANSLVKESHTAIMTAICNIPKEYRKA